MKHALFATPDNYPVQRGLQRPQEREQVRCSVGQAYTAYAVHAHALADICCQEGSEPVQLLQAWADGGMDWEDIYLHCVAPAARLLGAWWESDRMDFATVTIGVARLQQTLYDLSPTFLGGARTVNNCLSALLFCNPGSQHTIGVFMLGEFFRKKGWWVTGLQFPGKNGAIRSVQRDWFDVVGLSVSTNESIDRMGNLIADLRDASANPAIKIMVGGPLAAVNRGLVLSMGADFIGGDARESQRLAVQYVKNDPRYRLR